METVRLYYQDAHLREFSAHVVSCEPEKDHWAVVLDQTAFYPEGGGQPGDTGTLDSVRVLDTRARGEEIVHDCDAPLTPGSAVQGTIDWARRFDYMQQHSGEHIVSGIIHRRFGYENVGFHMGADMVTIDFSGMLTMDDVREIEREANEAVWANLPIVVSWVDGEEKANAVYRSKKPISGVLRLVSIPAIDVCACCGTHVSMTGEIGLVKIFTCQKFHDGVRLEMLCGRKAYSYVNSILEQNKRISGLLSAKPQQTAQAAERMLDELAQVKYRAGALELRLIAQAAEALAGKGDSLLFMELSADGLRQMADAGMHACGGVCAVFTGSDEAGWRYAIGHAGGDLRAFSKRMNDALHGRGGGKPEFVQGSVQASRAEIEAFWNGGREA
ncbi:MAG: alanyl-tRNA editing protein [Clostridiales bacterium]|nr:alanyl-tRNA editing protein [Clostridiales bacterium]